jgi:hypothetical protein
MKRLLALLLLLLPAACFGQEGTPVKSITGSGVPGGAVAHIVGTEYLDISQTPPVLYTCSSLNIAAGPSPPAGTITCNWTTIGSSGISSVSNSIYLSPNCTGNTAPCINIPTGGGCVNQVSVTNGQPTVTFTGSVPSALQVGMVAWVQLEHGSSGPCGSIEGVQIVGNPPQPQGEANYIGIAHSASGVQVTVTAINPAGLTATLSANSNTTTSGSAVWFFFGPNIYSQMHSACTAASASNGSQNIVSVAQGFYILDNTGNGTNAACNGAAGVVGAGFDVTYLLTPPWYNHEGDLGTVFHLSASNGVALQDLTLDGTWTALNVAIGRGTPIDFSNSLHVDRVNINGYNFGNGATSEVFYNAPGGAVSYISNSRIVNAIRGVAFQAASGLASRFVFENDYFQVGSDLIFTSVGNNQIEINGGYYEAVGLSPVRTMIEFGSAGSPSGDSIFISNATLCLSTASSSSVPLITYTFAEASGQIRINNTRINATGCPAVTTNATALTIISGWTARLSNVELTASGTGNTINNAGTLYQDLTTFQNTSGGAGYTGAGTNHHTETGTCTFAASTTCVVTFTEGFGATPNIFIPPNIPTTATTLTISAQSSTQFTITASASNSAAVGWSAVL